MKKAIITLALCLVAASTVRAQNSPTDSTARADTLQTPIYLVDSTYLGRSIFDVMPSRARGDAGTVTVRQNDSTAVALERHIIENRSREISGYRIRIYFSNDQHSREESAAAAAKFSELHPGYGVYRIYTSPNFKVTVGDFRNKSDALRLLSVLKQDFPYAFIVRENIRLY